MRGKIKRVNLTDKYVAAFVAILLAVPFGSLSDKWGRKPVGILAIVGLFLVTVSYEVVCKYPRPREMNDVVILLLYHMS